MEISTIILMLCVFPIILALKRPPGYFTNEEVDNKIVGGYNVTIQQYPYQAYLLLTQNDEDYQCGGSIISTQYILTAAHCLVGTTSVLARIGSTYANSGGTQHISRVFRTHPFYNSRTFDYDVGYIRFTFLYIDGVNSKIAYLAPSGSSVAPKTVLTVTGWGATREDGSVVQHLMAVQVPVVSNMQCRRSYSTITPRMLCAGTSQGGKDSCGGDSGGPAVTDDGIQRGIVSNGIGCGRPGIPGVYTNVSSVRVWITRNTGV